MDLKGPSATIVKSLLLVSLHRPADAAYASVRMCDFTVIFAFKLVIATPALLCVLSIFAVACVRVS